MLERILVRWLRVVAPDDWADSVLGDLLEEPRVGSQRWHLARIACRFTMERLRGLRVHRPLSPRSGGPTMIGDLRHGVRSLAKNPGFTLLAVVTLALAIGANTAIYSALRAIILEPLPFEDGERFVFLWHRNPQMSGFLATPNRQAIDQWRQLDDVFEGLESFVNDPVVVTEGGEPKEVPVTRIRPSLLPLVGISPVRGRSFLEADAAPDAPPVAVISHSLWLERFGGDSSAVGDTLRLGEERYTVIGIMPAGFALPFGADSIWVPERRAPDPERTESTLAKLRPGVTLDQAQRALDALGRGQGENGDDTWLPQLTVPADYHGSKTRVALYALSGAVGLLLLIACVNVAGLVLTRNSARTRELAVRHAIGASRGRLARQMLVESLLLATAGGLAGLLVAHWGIDSITALRPHNLEVLERVHLDTSALLFAAILSVLTAGLFGVAPALAAARVDLQTVLKAGGTTSTIAGLRTRRLLAMGQIAVALMLAVGASLLLRSYARLTAVDPGFDPDGVLSVRIDLPSSRYPAENRASRQAFYDEVLAAVRVMPGVVSAAVGSGVPPDMSLMLGTLAIQGRSQPSERRGVFTGGYVTPSYFETLRIPIVSGRAFSDDDRAGREPVVIVGQSLAERHWPGASAIGARVRISSSNEWATIVGVAGDVKGISMAGTGRPQIYYPRAQIPTGFGAIIVRTSGDPRPLIAGIKAAIWAIDPELPLQEIATADQLLGRATSQSRFSLALLSAFAACGLVLVIAGVYGVMALFVARRHRELSLRMALGASRGSIAMLVVRQSGGVLAGGLAVGALGAVTLSRFLQQLLFETSASDPISYLAAGSLIAIAAAAATLVPVSRALALDPVHMLRGE